MEYEPDALFNVDLVERACHKTDFTNNTRVDDTIKDRWQYHFQRLAGAPKYISDLCICDQNPVDLPNSRANFENRAAIILEPKVFEHNSIGYNLSCHAYIKFWNLVATRRIVDDRVKRIELIIQPSCRILAPSLRDGIATTLPTLVVRKGTYFTTKDILDAVYTSLHHRFERIDDEMEDFIDDYIHEFDADVDTIRAQSYVKGTLTLCVTLFYRSNTSTWRIF
jgi:hypothetical protein